jgi:hypothetical protein
MPGVWCSTAWEVIPFCPSSRRSGTSQTLTRRWADRQKPICDCMFYFEVAGGNAWASSSHCMEYVVAQLRSSSFADTWFSWHALIVSRSFLARDRTPRPLRPSRHRGEDEMTRQSHYGHGRECCAQYVAVVSKFRSRCVMMFWSPQASTMT